MTRRAAITLLIPKYDDDCFTERERALTSSEIPGTPVDLVSVVSEDSSGMVCRASRLPASGFGGDGLASRPVENDGEIGCWPGLVWLRSSSSLSRDTFSRLSGCSVGNSFCKTAL